MNERYADMVQHRTSVRACDGDGNLVAEGRVIGYIREPQLVIETPDGRHLTWRADQVAELEVTPPLAARIRAFHEERAA